MGDTPHDRATRTLDRDELEQLARESVEPPEGGVPVASRTATVSDPLTMASLAAAARDARKQELAADELLDHESEPLPHPNLKRR